MTAYLKEIESKRETSQMGLFDGLDTSENTGVHFELEKSKVEMTFEERMK